MKYENIQFGWIIIAAFTSAVAFLIIAYFIQLGDNSIDRMGLLVVSTVPLLLLLCFYRLKTVIEHDTIHLIYGIGLVHIKLKPTEITEVREVKIPFYAGLGIRFTPSGMLYNIQGNKAVAITYGKSKKTVRIGTPEPAVLKNAIITHFGGSLADESAE